MDKQTLDVPMNNYMTRDSSDVDCVVVEKTINNSNPKSWNGTLRHISKGGESFSTTLGETYY